LLGANAVSEVGNILTAVAVQWFTLQTTGSALQAGLVGMTVLIAIAGAGFLGGVLVDRVGFKRMSVLADVASGLAVALIPTLYHTVGLAFWQLLLLVFLGAILDAPGATARQSLVPDLASSAGMSLERANAAYLSVLSGANLVGPLVAGLLVAGVGATRVLWIDAATFAVSAIVTAAAVPSTPPDTARAGVPASSTYVADLRAGLAFIRRDQVILGFVVTSAMWNMVAGGLTGVALLVYANQVFGSAAQLGLIYAAAGAGLLLGGIAYGVAGPRLPRRLLLIASLVAAGLPIWLLALTPGIVVSVGLVLLRAAALGPIRPLAATILQERTPVALRGRVFGSYRALGIASGPLGILATGLSIDRFGLTATLLGLAAVFLATSIGAIVNPAFRRLEASDRDPAAGTTRTESDAGSARPP
jgi:MFS family permease